MAFRTAVCAPQRKAAYGTPSGVPGVLLLHPFHMFHGAGDDLGGLSHAALSLKIPRLEERSFDDPIPHGQARSQLSARDMVVRGRGAARYAGRADKLAV